ncbi:MerR family transcriptional regulator [Methylobacterium radiotolerans]|uniref:HTH merR-type domain-containing protein n=1 Tax=Methylobacterium radiotolerans (strain ATCC 27329 / DSM 1819 / JCM 2831 / NBRC 15690 / NCIMB 10815 / 0-1) TaxID=426355 RepID=B1LW83_METRJ|nr:hypothetical protein [Methylobacterium radiotolerans]ACB27146.1 hypothetical protein Mrad2831_5189 [Methylobacterium radiotolerans JCM 2831]GEM98372.1 hypothetical protein MRA01_29120 [Methylobacterium radiotolerans]
MFLDDRSFTTSTLTAAAGCEPMTFRTWRNRNGLFPEVAGGRNWKRFTVVDVCIVRAITVMTGHGLNTGNVVSFAQDHLRRRFDLLLIGETTSDLVGFFAGGSKTGEKVAYVDEDGTAKVALAKDLPEPKTSFVFLNDDARLAETLASTKGIITIIDLKALAQQVLDALPKAEV